MDTIKRRYKVERRVRIVNGVPCQLETMWKVHQGEGGGGAWLNAMQYRAFLRKVLWENIEFEYDTHGEEISCEIRY